MQEKDCFMHFSNLVLFTILKITLEEVVTGSKMILNIIVARRKEFYNALFALGNEDSSATK